MRYRPAMRKMAVLLVAVVFVLAAWMVPAGAKPSKSCVKALKAADHVQLAYELLDGVRADLMTATTKALTSTTDFATALNRVTGALNDASPKIRQMRSTISAASRDYDTAAKKCRKGR